jgi:photosystem II stability/assembly factor-like uncharacterized protein
MGKTLNNKKMKNLICVLFCVVFANLLNAQSSWVLQTNPLGTGNSAMVGKIQFVSPTEGWISAGNGKLLHTTNGGTNWTIVSPEPVDTLFSWSDPALSLCFINPTTGWIIHTKGSFSNMQGAVVYKTTNGGSNWNKLTIPNYDAGIYIQFVDANNGWIMIFNSNLTGGIFRTTNGGINWNIIEQPVGGFPFFINSNTGWLMPINSGGIGTTSDSIRKTTNGGLNWTAPWGTNAQVGFNAIHFSDINNGWAVGKNGLILKTTNGGNSWTYVTNTGITSSYKSKTVFFLNANTGWIGTKEDNTNNVFVLYTNNGGNSWTFQTPATGGSSIFNIHFFDALNGGLTSEDNILHTTNGGVWVKNISTEVPLAFSLEQNYPNPFNPTTNIRFDLPKSGSVRLVVFDALGREVATLVNEKLQPGTYEVDWPAPSGNGSSFASGVYFYKLSASNFVDVKKMLMIK